MIRNKDIVVVGLQPWDIEIGSNCKDVAIEFSKHNRVLYVNPPLDLNTVLLHRDRPAVRRRLQIRRSGDNLIEVAPNIWNLYPKRFIYSINWLTSHRLFDLFNKSNNFKFAADIREAMRKIGFGKFILFNDCDMLRSFYLIDMLKPALSLYYFRDHLMAVPYWYRHGHVFQPRLMAKSTLVCANSQYLLEIAKQYNPNTYNVGSGCDVSVFDPTKAAKLPKDMIGISGPIIGYIGAIIGYRLDLVLLEELCRRRKDWSFVFVGKTDKDFEESEMMNMPNVYFLGLKQEDELPAYLAHFDVAMNPQKINQMTVGNYPRKIDEYLSMGKATVATDTDFMREVFSNYVYLGNTVDDYEVLIGRALLEEKENPDIREKRIRFAQSHSWENHAEAIYQAIESAQPGWND